MLSSWFVVKRVVKGEETDGSGENRTIGARDGVMVVDRRALVYLSWLEFQP